jgi:hypothetical protein
MYPVDESHRSTLYPEYSFLSLYISQLMGREKLPYGFVDPMRFVLDLLRAPMWGIEYALDLCGCAMYGDLAPDVDVHEEKSNDRSL